ncbi:RNase P subunit p30-domain-containing protein [Lasiosphaeria miniovina]|uniref:RNase P subunit p30-domain-containing protein n=1 Tax=Lasiosphaeria miniovina TaxID=1954250 RepID=A0AA40EDF0_9PEZI|nr:RNase P subunit p30-domain-containing protein [Lasiosphaeria miniovina]KAK0734287.1 RNase P subunit p30-domain-containing protein [Lasiosphaeria miniovina]
MLYDLNLAWTPGVPTTELQRTLRFAKNLGYDVVALNHTVTGAIPTVPSAVVNPIPLLNNPTSTSPPPPPPSTTTKTTNLSTTVAAAIPPPSHSAAAAALPTILRRVTLVVTDPATTNYRLPDFARAYDVLAVRPANEKAFAWACLSTTEAPALISLDLAAFLGWHIHHRTAMAAVARGSRFEICYGQALGGAEARARANFIGNVQGLLRATKGRGIVISSGGPAGSTGTLGLRAPADVVNLLAVWGLGPERGAEALGAGARAVVVNEGIKRRGFRGIVDIVKDANSGDKAASRKNKNSLLGGGKAQNSASTTPVGRGQKRKNGNATTLATAAAESSSSAGGSNPPQQQTLSKRQAKKLKLEGSKAEAGAAAGGKQAR